MVDVHSDPGHTRTSTRRSSSTWHERGVEMRLYMYFAVRRSATGGRTRSARTTATRRATGSSYHGTYFRDAARHRVHRRRRPRRRPTATVGCASRTCNCSRSFRPPRARTRRRSTRSTSATTTSNMPNDPMSGFGLGHADAARHRDVHAGDEHARVHRSHWTLDAAGHRGHRRRRNGKLVDVAGRRRRRAQSIDLAPESARDHDASA